MRKLAVLLFCLTAAGVHAAGPFRVGGPATTNNDDSCDISVLPAATLLLPYFEVDIKSAAGTGETTIFTITNTTNMPQVARVTLWTDFGYPVMDFNLFLTGYDVQSINLFDVIRRGLIAPDAGTGFDVSNVGELSGDEVNDIVWDNPVVNEATCQDLPVEFPQVYVTRMQQAFTTGKVPSAGQSRACTTAGDVHENAVGYATIDVSGACLTSLPTDASYFATDIRFDNVLTGDYLQINGNEDSAQGGPLVHIRAIPEGGTPQTRAADDDYRVNFERTFYSRFQPAATPVRDARQPLPATFAARWVSGGATGFQTFFKIWREGRSDSATVCSAYPATNGGMDFVEMVRFDEDENPEVNAPRITGPPLNNAPVFPATSMIDAGEDERMPMNSQGAVAGWFYLNLDNHAPGAGQNWVITSMRAEDRFSVDIDALALGNGCTAPVTRSEAKGGQLPLGPAPNGRP